MISVLGKKLSGLGSVNLLGLAHSDNNLTQQLGWHSDFALEHQSTKLTFCNSKFILCAVAELFFNPCLLSRFSQPLPELVFGRLNHGRTCAPPWVRLDICGLPFGENPQHLGDGNFL